MSLLNFLDALKRFHEYHLNSTKVLPTLGLTSLEQLAKKYLENSATEGQGVKKLRTQQIFDIYISRPFPLLPRRCENHGGKKLEILKSKQILDISPY